MKRIPAMLEIAVVVLMLSCNNGPAKEENQSTETAADTSVAVVSPPAEVKPAFTPFKVVIIQHKVADLGKSMTDYFNRESLRQTYGISHYLLGQNLKDPKTVFVMDKIEDMDKAKAFYAQAEVKDAMKKAGVSSPPGFTYAEIVRNNDAPSQYNDGLSITHRVKDYATWLMAYEAEGAETRSANGLIERGIARNLQDSNTVSIIFEVSDMAKAKARVASPELKKIMTDAGVDGPPTIRWFSVIK